MALPPSIERGVTAATGRLALLGGLQALLSGCRDQAARKTLVLAAYETGAIDGPECTALVEAHLLETA